MKAVSSWKIYELLGLIEDKPHFFLTSKSITALQDFLTGYFARRIDDNETYHPGEPSLDNFKYWVLARRGPEGGIGSPYRSTLLPECEGDEEKAFYKFFELLREFKEESTRSDIG